MKFPHTPGEQKEHIYKVESHDVAAFHGEVVHPVCSTFTLSREMEWAGRLFVLEMIGEDEEGVGTHVHVDHKSPAAVGETLVFKAILTHQDAKGNVQVDVVVSTKGGRVVATGSTGQRILPKTVINTMFSKVDL